MANSKLSNLSNYFIKYGFVLNDALIYNGLENTFVYGPLFLAIKTIIKQKWIQEFITNKNCVLIESPIITNPDVYLGSKHLKQFKDCFIDCKNCKKRFRSDENNSKISSCQFCKSEEITNPRNFQLMFEVNKDKFKSEKVFYLRPETAQGIFINYKEIGFVNNLKLPFGIGQIGKSFRNEINLNNFLFRLREFEQMELEYFFEYQNLNQVEQLFSQFENLVLNFLTSFGLKKENILLKNVEKNDLAHYAQKTTDFEFKFRFGTFELCGLSYRKDFDLLNHQEFSKKKLYYLNSKNEKIIPHVIEPSIGIERLILAIIDSNLTFENNRYLLNIPFAIAPFQIAILPLVKKLNEPAIKIFNSLKNEFRCTFQDKKSIGKRYYYQDAIGTFFAICFDYDSLVDFKVTIRIRNNKEQKRILISEIKNFINKFING